MADRRRTISTGHPLGLQLSGSLLSFFSHFKYRVSNPLFLQPSGLLSFGVSSSVPTWSGVSCVLLSSDVWKSCHRCSWSAIGLERRVLFDNSEMLNAYLVRLHVSDVKRFVMPRNSFVSSEATSRCQAVCPNSYRCRLHASGRCPFRIASECSSMF